MEITESEFSAMFTFKSIYNAVDTVLLSRRGDDVVIYHSVTSVYHHVTRKKNRGMAEVYHPFKQGL